MGADVLRSCGLRGAFDRGLGLRTSALFAAWLNTTLAGRDIGPCVVLGEAAPAVVFELVGRLMRQGVDVLAVPRSTLEGRRPLPEPRPDLVVAVIGLEDDDEALQLLAAHAPLLVLSAEGIEPRLRGSTSLLAEPATPVA